jgi:hypothetical protein
MLTLAGADQIVDIILDIGESNPVYRRIRLSAVTRHRYVRNRPRSSAAGGRE